jgi:hypothetical protein
MEAISFTRPKAHIGGCVRHLRLFKSAVWLIGGTYRVRARDAHKRTGAHLFRLHHVNQRRRRTVSHVALRKQDEEEVDQRSERRR